MTDLLKDELIACLKQAGAYDVRMADPAVGFEHAPDGQHPRERMPQCRTVIVFALAMSPETNNTYLGPLAAKDLTVSPGRPVEPSNVKPSNHNVSRLSSLFHVQVVFAGVTFLHERGFATCLSGRHKLCAYEAGIGRYGRSGLILHPELGNRMTLGVILTDAILAPDPKREDHDPCRNCDRCIRACPAGAFDPDKTYPDSWSFDLCMPKRKEIAAAGQYCHNCFAVCPAGRYRDEDLLFQAQATSYLGADRIERKQEETFSPDRPERTQP
jgi:epoxyqueuosine reductase QueG